MSKSQNPKKLFQKAIESGYQLACHFWKIVVYRKVVFKGFFNPEIGQEILNNPEILASLGVITPQQKKILEEELTEIILAKPGVALPAKTETWIILNPYYLEAEFSQRFVLDIVETMAHEIAHAVVFNWDIYWGHVPPHGEMTKYLQDYYLNNLGYDWEWVLSQRKF